MPDRRSLGRPETEQLRGVVLFATLSTATLSEIAGVATIHTVPADTHVLFQDDDCTAAYFILTGAVRIYRISAEGREQVLVRLGSGQAFNTAPIFQARSTNPAHVVTLPPTSLCTLGRDDLLRLVAAHSDLALALLRDFADRLTHLTDLVEGLALHSVQERLARFLLDQVAPLSGADGEDDVSGGPSERHRWTQQEIAVHLGTVRDVVGRELRTMAAAGILRLERGRIVLVSRRALEELAHR